MKKRVFSLLTALILLVTSLQITAFAAPVSDDIHPQYTYSNNGYTLEKVSHADVAPPARATASWTTISTRIPDGKICTGVIEHMYEEGADTPSRYGSRTGQAGKPC